MVSLLEFWSFDDSRPLFLLVVDATGHEVDGDEVEGFSGTGRSTGVTGATGLGHGASQIAVSIESGGLEAMFGEGR